MHLWQSILQRWHAPNGYREALRIGIPLVISMGSATLMLFTDRIFLGRYSVDAIAAAGPSGALAFIFLAFCAGIGGYVNTFIAQYSGAGMPEKVGRALWQAIYFSLLAGIFLAVGATLGRPLFNAVNHPAEIREMEMIYFRILMLGGLPHVLRDVLACFFSGRGLTRPIMVVSIIITIFNIPLDYAMINGLWIIPEMGIAGAGWATVISHCLGSVLFIALIFRRSYEKRYKIISQWQFDPALFKRLLRYGLPSGMQIAADILAFSFFLLIIGRLGRTELAVTNIVFSINSLVFMPMLGLSIATATLVGQAIGRGRPEDGVQATYSTMHLTTLYMGILAICLVAFPKQLLSLFLYSGASAAETAEIIAIGTILLRFVALYSLPDVLNLIYAGALRGAGDIRFVTWSIAILSFFGMLLPAFIAIELMGMGLYTAWIIITCYITILALVFRWRFRQGHWKTMRVIEPSGAILQGGIGPNVVA